MRIKDTNIFNTVGVCIWKKPMIKSEIYLLFSYQTEYIMWHSRDIYLNDFFLLEAFWLDVTTSRDECTCTRLNSVVSTRKRPFTEEYRYPKIGPWFEIMTSVDADLRSGRRLEIGRRSESIIYIYIQYNIDSNAGIQLSVDLHLS